MTRKTIRKVMMTSAIIVAVLGMVIALHVYLVTRRAPDKNTVALARIDVQQHIDASDAGRIGQWLSMQQGVEHYLCNTQTNIVVFTFRPAIVSATDITENLSKALNYKVVRHVPTAQEMSSGCPVAATSVTYKIAKFFRHIL